MQTNIIILNDILSKLNKSQMVALIVGIIAGVPYLLATPKVQPTEPPYTILAVVQGILLIGGFALAFKYHQRAWIISLLILSGIQLVVLGRIVYDTISGEGSHNMWPFEFAVSTILCAPMSFISTYLGFYVHSIFGKRLLAKNVDDNSLNT